MTLALIAGTGDLPRHVAAACAEPPLVAALEGFLPAGVKPDLTFRFETLGSLITDLQARGVTQLCLVGGVRRPVLDPARIDAATQPLIAQVQSALRHGDDAALRAFLDLFEHAGFTILGASDIAPDLVSAAGCLTKAQPTQQDHKDAERGRAIIAAMGAADVGQACVVADGQALAIEALPGTDWMLKSLTVPAPEPVGETGTFVDDLLGGAADWLSASTGAQADRIRDPDLPLGGVLVKGPKPDQNLQVDMPTIGPVTVEGAARAGLRGIAIAANAVLFLDRETTVQRANDLGLFLWAMEEWP
ncbi:LpxI family protein [Shimia ponticola]|uniref:LpxI family protein n=1 Tax=Shimia ponticola TaxID=2582893 RepID=UPI0011BE7E8A|nr:UDP-2,3-diacylglucosamine diphosphatase LpxI [Shimia ponticola]